MGFIKLTYYSK